MSRTDEYYLIIIFMKGSRYSVIAVHIFVKNKYSIHVYKQIIFTLVMEGVVLSGIELYVKTHCFPSSSTAMKSWVK